MTLLLTDWKVLNANDECIDVVSTSRNNRKAASDKIKFKYGTFSPFLHLKKWRDREFQK